METRSIVRFSPPSKAYDGYIFDCDGTLIDSMPLHHRAWREALASGGATFDFDWSLFTSRAGMPLIETVVALNQQFDTTLDPEAVVVEQRRVYRSLLPSVRAIDSVVEFARRVAEHAPAGVASGGHQQEVEQSLEGLQLRGLFACVVTSNDVRRGKPDPEMFLRCAELLGVPARSCLVIEDGELGIEAARRAGMDWARVEARES